MTEPLRYDALTLDTQVIQSNGFRFDHGRLELLKQFRASPIKVVISEIVVCEVIDHLETRLKTTRDSLSKALKEAREVALLDESDSLNLDAIDPRKTAEERLGRFLAAIGAEIVGPEGADLKRIVERYFKPAPPFASSANKKHEFPDAIALFSLEAWARRNGRRMLAVSGDKGWADFAKGSEVMDLQDDLSVAIATVRRNPDYISASAHRFMKEIYLYPSSELAQDFREKLAEAVSTIELIGNGYSSFDIEIDDVELSLNEYRFVNQPEDEIELLILESDPDTVTVEVHLEITATASASVSFSAYDSVDKDSVSLGSEAIAAGGQEIEVKGLVKFALDDESGAGHVESIEITDAPSELELGDLEPDWSGDQE